MKLASDWLRAERKGKQMDDDIARYFTHFGNYIDLTTWDFSLHFGSCCLLRFCHKFGPKLVSHYKPVKNKVYFDELSEPCLANYGLSQETKFNKYSKLSSVKQMFAQLRMGFRVIK